MKTKIRLYFSDKIQSDLVAHLKKEQSHYLKDVMRLKEGDIFSVFNNQGEWNASLQSYKKQEAEIKILKKVRDRKNENDIWLAFTPIKQNPLNFIIQKGTELGVQKFIPVLSERTIVKDINIERIKKIIIESSEQSNRISVPEISKLETLKNFISNFPQKGCLVFCDINSNKSDLKSILSKKDIGPICILIGPEGDFSENERKLIIDLNQSYSISLATNILRAETAALTAVALVNYHLNLS
ncbi:16S rRNA (uracil(1498)-N(3))-methyltransferase [Pelagibacteraceae bacterium]|jgi:16S rRNA (uracil1498-N3)-methyltransferase|nr:16S rRNA (uracil(1498)-N(3))-methyltransferase [Pelagibacteraceae bacterium]